MISNTTGEKITAVYHEDGERVWVICHMGSDLNVSNIFKALPFQANKLRQQKTSRELFRGLRHKLQKLLKISTQNMDETPPKGQKFYVSCSSSCSCTRVPARPARLHVSFATISTSAFD
jgi:hypothetical protein